jgi:hypothetical protein
VPRSGISYAPELEWRLAARWNRYKWHEFQALDGDEQSKLVAAYRVQNQIEAVLAWDNRPKGA